MSSELSTLYKERFGPQELDRKNKLWRVLCTEFLQKFVAEESTVLDIGAGYCEFINNIRARRKYAVDLNEDTHRFAAPDVEVFMCSATRLDFLPDNSIDVTFVSNFLEHLRTKEDVFEVLREIHRVSKPVGHVLVLQPNIKYAYKQYWDFFDHHIPLSDKSLAEALVIAGFDIDRILPRFLPYSTKSRLPTFPLLVKLYLKVPLVWRILGKQAFVVARKRS